MSFKKWEDGGAGDREAGEKGGGGDETGVGYRKKIWGRLGKTVMALRCIGVDSRVQRRDMGMEKVEECKEFARKVYKMGAGR